MNKIEKQKTNIWDKIANFSVKLFPLFFLLVVYFFPIEEAMVCNKDNICTVDRKYIFNIKTEEKIKINSQSELFFRKEKYINIPVSSRYSHPRHYHGFILKPVLQDVNNQFHTIFKNSSWVLSSEDAADIAQKEKLKFENYKKEHSFEYKLIPFKEIYEINLFVIIYSFGFLVYLYFIYKKYSYNYNRIFYTLMLIVLIVVFQKLFSEFQYL